MKSENVLVAQSCLTLCDPMDYSPPGSSVHGILQARILEWVAISFSRGSSQPRDQTGISCIVDSFFTIWTTGEAFKITIMRKIWFPYEISTSREWKREHFLFEKSYYWNWVGLCRAFLGTHNSFFFFMSPTSCLASQAFPAVSKSKFNQRSEKMEKQRKEVKQNKVIVYP